MPPWYSPTVPLALMLAGAGCAEAPDPRPVRDERPGRVEVRPGVRLDRLLAARGDATPVLDVMRAPRDRHAEAVANRHVEGQTDSLVTWVYDGLTLEIYAVTAGPAFVRRVVVTRGMYGTSDGLSVGEPRASMEETLGRPSAEVPGAVSYRLGGETPVFVDVTYAPDDDGVERAARIAWRLPVD